MATTVEIDAAINTADYAKSVGEINKSLKALIGLQGQVGAGSAEYKKLQSAINDTEGKLGDLKDSFQTLRGSGIERVNSSLGLLREGFLNADPGKLSIAFDGLGAAMKAIPIFLLIEGFKLLIDNFSKITAAFSDSAKSIEANKAALEELNREIAANKTSTDQLIITKEAELRSLQAQSAGLQLVIDKINEINGLRQTQLKDELKSVDKEIQNALHSYQQLKASFENKSETESLLQFFGFDIGTTEKDLKEAEKVLFEAQLKRGQLTTRQLAQEVSANEQKNTAIRDAEEKERVAREKRIAEFQAFLKEKNAQEIAIEEDRIAIENRLREEEIAAVKKQIDEQKLAKFLFLQGQADQDKEFAEREEAKRRLRLENQLAYNKSFRKASLDSQIEGLTKERDALLLNEQLTQQHRIKIIEDTENKIFQLKVKKAQELISYTQQVVGILNSFNQIQTQNENYELNQRQYAKDAAIENDNNRTQEAIYREQQRSAALLQNDKLTAEQREAISANSEKIQEQISLNSKNNQLSINNKFEQAANDIRKKQFERNKKLQIAQGIVNTAASVLQTLSSTPYPANIPLAFAAAAAGAAQVAIISSQKYDDGGLSARQAVRPADIGVSSSSGQQSTFSPNQSISQPGSVQFDPTKVQNAQGNKSTRVYVLESDIREVMGKVDVFESRANF